MADIFIDVITSFDSSISKYIDDKTFMQYLQIVKLNPQDYKKPDCKAYKRLVDSQISYPTIWKQIFLYLKTRVSLLTKYNHFSEQQLKYITNPNTGDTKLIACPGAGKTRSIIARARFMVEHGLAEKDEIFAITFSKHAAEDFEVRIKEMYPDDYKQFFNLNNFSTIDSLAKSILCQLRPHKSSNVEILSIAFRNLLREINDTDLKIIRKHKSIKFLYIDESQDLNEVQYDIAIQLRKIRKACVKYFKRIYGSSVNLIADPNQMIYSFRRANNSYFINFHAELFEFTLNYRSTQEIIDFFECFKPIPTSRCISANNKHGKKPQILTGSMSEIHKTFIKFVNSYTKDLCNIAVACPTRGIKSYDNIGLSVFFNLLKQNNIDFVQLYDEAGRSDEYKKSSGKVSGHINLITYHGTKGLEFDVVWVMDFYQNLFNIQPTKKDHELFQYLLYVVTSRPMNLLYVCTYTNHHNGEFTHWLSKVNPNLYETNNIIRISKLSLRNEEIKNELNGITELLTELNDVQLDEIHNCLTVYEEFGNSTKRVFEDFTHIDRGKDEALFGTFVQELFYLQHKLSRGESVLRYKLIEQIINEQCVIIPDDKEFQTVKKYVKARKLTWESYMQSKNDLDIKLQQLIEKNFPRDQDPCDYVICSNAFITIVNKNRKDIEETYDKYQHPKKYDYDYRKILKDFFYLIVVEYAYNNNHYSYINDHGVDKSELLNNFDLFRAINRYAIFDCIGKQLDMKVNTCYKKLDLYGEIDYIEQYNQTDVETIVEIKCVKGN